MSELFALVVVICALILVHRFTRSKKHVSSSAVSSARKPAISVSITSSGFDSVPDAGIPVPGTNAGEWIINPRASFPLTIYPTTEAVAKEIKRLLDERFNWGAGVAQARVIGPVMLREGLRCKEVDAYVARYKRKYLGIIESEKRTSSEWAKASEPDRKDLCEEFERKALELLEVSPAAMCDVRILFSDNRDASSCRHLIGRFGLENVQFYARLSSNPSKVHVVPASHSTRTSFEKLVEAGLAVRGLEVGIPNILGSLTLRELQEVASSASHKRKAAAIEYVAGLEDVSKRLEKRLALREFFKLQPLLGDLAALNMDRVLGTFRYTHEVAVLVSHTYVMSGYDLRDRCNDQGSEFIKGWKVLASDGSCPACVKAASKIYAKESRPKIPHHIGCRCCISPEVT